MPIYNESYTKIFYLLVIPGTFFQTPFYHNLQLLYGSNDHLSVSIGETFYQNPNIVGIININGIVISIGLEGHFSLFIQIFSVDQEYGLFDRWNIH